MSQADRSALEHRLATFLGFDDAVSDIFEQLLTIDSSEDLLEYLSQLLGDDSEAVKKFVHDVERFKRGDALTSAICNETDSSKESTKVKQTKNIIVSDAAAEHRAKVAAAEKEAKEKQKRQERERELERQRQKDELSKKKKQQQSAQKKPAAGKQKKTGASIVKKKNAEKTAQQTNESSKKVPPPAAAAAASVPADPPTSEKPPPPQRGKAKTICGCFGTHCKPLTNCLQCGRILCEKEGYGYCPFCGYLIEKLPIQKGKNKNLDKALLHKERLLKFDREFARRTVILDDQADYFSNTTSAWLTEDEQIEAEQRDEEKRREMHERKGQKMNIAF